MEEVAVTSRANSTKLGTPSGCLTTSGGRPSTSPTQSLRYTGAVSCRCSYGSVLENWREWRGKAVHLSHQKPAENAWHLLAQDHFSVARRARVRSPCKDAGGGWVMSLQGRTTPLARQPFTGWTPEDRHRRGRPTNTWWRCVEVEIKTMKHSCGTTEKLAEDRQGWKSFVAALKVSTLNGQ